MYLGRRLEINIALNPKKKLELLHFYLDGGVPSLCAKKSRSTFYVEYKIHLLHVGWRNHGILKKY